MRETLWELWVGGLGVEEGRFDEFGDGYVVETRWEGAGNEVKSKSCSHVT
jgi:hypothetical protein